MTPLIVAVEDALSAAVARRMVAAARTDLYVSTVIRKNGRSQIEGRIGELNRTAATLPVFVLVDLDRPTPCPADLLRSWLPSSPNSKLLFRVAVMEIESWVIAHRDAFAKFMGIALHRVPERPDEVPNPKELIVTVARKSKRKEIREDFVPDTGDTRIVGPAYNAQLTAFVASEWDPDKAAAASPSLHRALLRLRSAFQST